MRQINFYTERLHVIAYPATLDVSRDLVRFVGRLLYAERRAAAPRGDRGG